MAGRNIAVGIVGLVLISSGCSAGGSDDEGEPSTKPNIAEVPAELSRNALSRTEAETVLKLIDDICGDSWCEGDHNFRFDRIECQTGCRSRPGSCSMTFRIFPYDSDVQAGPTYVRTCTTGGFRNFESLVATAPNGYQSLQPAYYDALSECISRIESQLPPPS